MNRIIIIAVVSMLCAHPCLADQFQLRKNDGTILRYAQVLIKDNRGRRVATRYTDKLGRFEYRARGSFNVEVGGLGASIRVRHDNYLKRVNVR